jgi:hypothetical protein
MIIPASVGNQHGADENRFYRIGRKILLPTPIFSSSFPLLSASHFLYQLERPDKPVDLILGLDKRHSTLPKRAPEAREWKSFCEQINLQETFSLKKCKI